MTEELKGKRFAVLAMDGFEQSELIAPCEAIKQAGGTVDIVAPKSGHIQGMLHLEKGENIAVDRTIGHVTSTAYAGLVLPGGVANPAALRLNQEVVSFVREFVEEQKPVAAICHTPWTLIQGDVVRSRTVTSWPSLTDPKNAGATWADQEIVVDGWLVTSRSPGDLPSFCRKMFEEFRRARSDRQHPAGRLQLATAQCRPRPLPRRGARVSK